MYNLSVRAGTTDVEVSFKVLDNTTGLPVTGLDHASAGIDLWYRRQGATKTSITEASLAALTTAHTDGGVEEIGNGVYRLDLPDAACAASASFVEYGGTFTGYCVIGGRIDLTTESAADVATAVLDRALSGHTTAGTVGKAISDVLADTGTDGVVIPDGSLTAAKFAADSLAAMADAIHDEVVEGTTTLRQSSRLWNSVLGGKASGLDTQTPIYRDLADTKNRVSATTDEDGNRSAITRDLT